MSKIKMSRVRGNQIGVSKTIHQLHLIILPDLAIINPYVIPKLIKRIDSPSNNVSIQLLLTSSLVLIKLLLQTIRSRELKR